MATSPTRPPKEVAKETAAIRLLYIRDYLAWLTRRHLLAIGAVDPLFQHMAAAGAMVATALCQLHMDCLNCNELVCIKGDGAREANIRCIREETRTLLEEARSATVEQVYGANRWVEHQSKTLARLEQLCGILDDPSVPEGAVIRLAPTEQASRLQQAVRVQTQSMPT
jgi:hypothetical protein